MCVFTGEEALCAQEADAEPEDGQLVQAGDDVLGEGQQARQALQLRVQTIAVPFGWVGLAAFSWGRFDSGGINNKQKFLINNKILMILKSFLSY